LFVAALYAREQSDIFEVYYRANSAGRIRVLAYDSGLVLSNLEDVPDPTYLAFSERTFRLAIFLEGLMPPGTGVHLVGLLHRE
jgi:hypothetical protein